MKLMDYFFYKTYRFLIRLKKNEGDAKWSAFLHTGVYVAILIISLVCLFGLSYENPLSQLMKSNPLVFWMTTFIVSPFLISIRYYRYTSVASIESSYSTMSESKRKFVDVLLYIVLIATPLLTFTLFRLYVIGHFKWW